MKERGILMSGDNPKLILDGSKTQTRRIVKLPKKWKLSIAIVKTIAFFQDIGFLAQFTNNGGGNIPCPYGVAGDRLWVRETWAAPTCYDGEKPRDLPDALAEGDEIIYRAKSPDYRVKELGSFWRSPYHMPRWASRITLEITKVRVERLQDISEAAAKAEGVQPQCKCCYGLIPCSTSEPTWIHAYRQLWDSINGKGVWDKNPWVWVLEFAVVNPQSAIRDPKSLQVST